MACYKMSLPFNPDLFPHLPAHPHAPGKMYIFLFLKSSLCFSNSMPFLLKTPLLLANVLSKWKSLLIPNISTHSFIHIINIYCASSMFQVFHLDGLFRIPIALCRMIKIFNKYFTNERTICSLILVCWHFNHLVISSLGAQGMGVTPTLWEHSRQLIHCFKNRQKEPWGQLSQKNPSIELAVLIS